MGDSGEHSRERKEKGRGKNGGGMLYKTSYDKVKWKTDSREEGCGKMPLTSCVFFMK